MYFTKNSFKFLINHLGNKNINNLVVEKSKFFFENNNKEISTISTINKLNYFQNFKTNQKKLKIKGDIFDTKFDFLWNKDLNKKDYQISISNLEILTYCFKTFYILRMRLIKR